MARTVLVLALLALMLVACDRSEDSRAADTESSEHPALTPEEAMKAPRPRHVPPPEPFNETPPPLLLSATEVLIQYEGANNSKATRTSAEARAKATEILDRARKGEPLQSLAARFSDGPSKQGGGFLGSFTPESVDAALAEAIQSIGFGEIYPDVVETPFGYHVVQREKVVHIGHVLIMHREARRAHSEISRTPEEAQAEAGRVRGLLAAAGADLAGVAKAHSDCRRTKLIGGDLGYYGKGAIGYRGGRLLPELIKAVAPLAPGEVSEVVESDYGFHIAWLFPDEAPSGTPSEKAPAEVGTGRGPDAGPGKNKR